MSQEVQNSSSHPQAQLQQTNAQRVSYHKQGEQGQLQIGAVQKERKHQSNPMKFRSVVQGNNVQVSPVLTNQNSPNNNLNQQLMQQLPQAIPYKQEQLSQGNHNSMPNRQQRKGNFSQSHGQNHALYSKPENMQLHVQQPQLQVMHGTNQQIHNSGPFNKSRGNSVQTGQQQNALVVVVPANNAVGGAAQQVTNAQANGGNTTININVNGNLQFVQQQPGVSVHSNNHSPGINAIQTNQALNNVNVPPVGSNIMRSKGRQQQLDTAVFQFQTNRQGINFPIQPNDQLAQNSQNEEKRVSNNQLTLKDNQDDLTSDGFNFKQGASNGRYAQNQILKNPNYPNTTLNKRKPSDFKQEQKQNPRYKSQRDATSKIYKQSIANQPISSNQSQNQGQIYYPIRGLSISNQNDPKARTRQNSIEMPQIKQNQPLQVGNQFMNNTISYEEKDLQNYNQQSVQNQNGNNSIDYNGSLDNPSFQDNGSYAGNNNLIGGRSNTRLGARATISESDALLQQQRKPSQFQQSLSQNQKGNSGNNNRQRFLINKSSSQVTPNIAQSWQTQPQQQQSQAQQNYQHFMASFLNQSVVEENESLQHGNQQIPQNVKLTNAAMAQLNKNKFKNSNLNQNTPNHSSGQVKTKYPPVGNGQKAYTSMGQYQQQLHKGSGILTNPQPGNNESSEIASVETTIASQEQSVSLDESRPRTSSAQQSRFAQKPDENNNFPHLTPLKQQNPKEGQQRGQSLQGPRTVESDLDPTQTSQFSNDKKLSLKYRPPSSQKADHVTQQAGIIQKPKQSHSIENSIDMPLINKDNNNQKQLQKSLQYDKAHSAFSGGQQDLVLLSSTPTVNETGAGIAPRLPIKGQDPTQVQSLRLKTKLKPQNQHVTSQTPQPLNSLPKASQNTAVAQKPKAGATMAQSQTVQSNQVGNCVMKFAYATKQGVSPKNPNKQNQDQYIVLPHLGEYRRTHLFAVCDGHGANGKLVSEFIKLNLSENVEVRIKRIFDDAKAQKRVIDSSEVKEELHASFTDVENSLVEKSNINLRFSGSTCVAVLIVGNKVFCANVGDSRAMLVRTSKPHSYTQPGQFTMTAIALNRDHKADESDERQRILASNGRVESYRDSNGNQLGPLRVWHLHQNIPGLAMTRSFGDLAAKDVGVIAEPEITEITFQSDDRFMVIASDGVWEFLSNEQVASIVLPFYQRDDTEGAAERLVYEAQRKWHKNDNSVDDITCIIVFLNINQ